MKVEDLKGYQKGNKRNLKISGRLRGKNGD